MKKIVLLLVFMTVFCSLHAQNVTITPSGITPALSGTYPRISYDAILALPSPVLGDMAYDITFKCLRSYNGSKWICSYQSPTDPTNILAIASAGGTSIDAGNSIAVDALGNVYVTGSYDGTANFGGTSITSLGGIFIAKYNSSGTIQWVRSAGGTTTDYALGIAVDASGSVYVTGYYQGTSTFGGTSISSVGSNADIFVAKYSSAGVFQWVRSAGGAGSDIAAGIDVDGSGNVYVTGRYEGTATFGGLFTTSVGNKDIFVAKYNSSGTVQWVRSGGGAGFDEGTSIAVDGLGNVYVTGQHIGTLTFDGTTIVLANHINIFVTKYNSAGTFQWARSAGGTGFDEGNGIAVDASNNVYLTGRYDGTANFGGTLIASAGGSDVFVAKYNSAGTAQWARSAGGASNEFGLSIAVYGLGNIYVTGFYNGTARFGGSSITSVGNTDIFVARMDN